MQAFRGPEAHRAFGVALSGLMAGAISGYATRPEGLISLIWIMAAAILGHLLLTGTWLLVSARLANAERLDASSSRQRAAWPFIAFASLPVLFLPFIDYQTQRELVVYQPPLLDVKWQMIYVLFMSVLLVAALLILRFETLKRNPFSAIPSRPALTLAVMILVWIVIASILEYFKVYYLNTPGNNIPTFIQALNNAFSDKGPLYSDLLQADGSSLLGVHANYVWFLIFPLFRIWPHYVWLIAITNVFLGLAAIPIYLLSRQFFSKVTSLLLVLVFLFHRAIIAQPAVADLSEQRFLPLLLLSSIYFWYKRRFWLFLFFAVLALTVREDVGLVLFFLGAVSLLNKRSLKWWLTPILIGVTWFVSMITTIIPAFNPAAKGAKALALYPNLGDSGSEILKTVLLKPWVLIETAFFNLGHLATLYQLWQSFGFGVVFLSPMLLLSFPYVGEFLLYRASLSLSHFNAIGLTAAFFPAFIIGLAAFKRLTVKKWQESAVVVLVLLSLFANIVLAYTWLATARYGPRYNYETCIKVMQMIPPESSVVLPEFLGIKAEPNQDIRNYGQLVYASNNGKGLELWEEYVVIDAFVPESNVQGQYLDGLRLLEEAIKASPEYVLQFEGDDLQLYHRENRPPARQP